MSQKIIRLSLILCVVVCGTAMRAAAQQPQPTGMTPEKRALIKELIEVTGTAKTAQTMMDSILAQTEKMSDTLMADAISESQVLSREEQEELRQKSVATRARLNKRVKELMAQRIDLTKILEEVSNTVYDKYFTEADLKDLIVFYRSPTGKKSIELMPKIFADSTSQTAELIMPKLQQILKEIMDEERKNRETIPNPAAQHDTRPRP